jgi:hypothetical protein
MTIKFSRSRSVVGAVAGGPYSSSKHTRKSFGTGLIALGMAAASAAGCPGQLDVDAVQFDGGRSPIGGAGVTAPPPPAPVAGTGGRGGRAAGGMGGSTPRRIDAPQANCWEPAEITNRILLPKCANAGCHSSAMPAAMLDLQAMGARLRLQNVPSRMCVQGGVGRPLVTVQGNNVTGHLFDKLAGNQPMACGARMPRNGMMAGYLNATEVQCLKEWFIRSNQGGGQRPPDAGPPAAPGSIRPKPPVGFCANPATDAVTKVLQPLCGVMCHNPQIPAALNGNLDLLNPVGVRARLEGVAAKLCPGKTLIIPGRPEGFLFDKVQRQVPGNCGTPMPPVVPYLHPDEIKCLKDWIAPGVAQ